MNILGSFNVLYRMKVFFFLMLSDTDPCVRRFDHGILQHIGVSVFHVTFLKRKFLCLREKRTSLKKKTRKMIIADVIDFYFKSNQVTIVSPKINYTIKYLTEQ